MAWIEDTSRRSAKAKHYTDSLDATHHQVVLTIHDQHYKDESDVWQDVDENFVDDGLDGFAKKCDKTRHIFRVGNGGARRWYPRRNVQTEYVDITNIQYWRAAGGGSWRNINLPTPVWSGSGGDWDMANLHASLVNTWKRIKAEFILKDATAPTRLRFAVSFTGLTYNAATGELTSTTDGQVWGYINAPIAQDANGANVAVTQIYDGTYIEWSADTTGAAYPVYVDPTFTDGYGGDVTTAKDTTLSSANSDKAKGGDDVFYPTWAAEASLMQFDLSSIDSGATCNSATFSIYNNEVLTGDRILYVHSLLVANNGWIEGATEDPATANQSTWDYKNQTGSGAGTAWAGSAGASTQGTDYSGTWADPLGKFTYVSNSAAGTEISCTLKTSVVVTWFGGSNSNYGVRMMSDDPRFPAIRSSDHATTSTRPKLVVDYTEGGVTKSLTDTGTGTDNKPTISASLSGIESGIGTDIKPTIVATLSQSDVISGLDSSTLSALLSLPESGIGIDSHALAASLGLDDGILGGDFLSLSASLSVYDTASIVEDITIVISGAVITTGSTVWGHSTGALETNIRTFTGNWTGTGSITGVGDEEKLVLDTGQYMISEVVNTGIDTTITLLQNEYSSGDTVTLQYRHGATQVACEAASWNDYTVSFESLGYVQVRVAA